MHGLIRVLQYKIVFTALGYCLPLLLLPSAQLQQLGFPVPAPLLFLRLLGMAYTALVVGYALGLRSALRGHYPADTVGVGVVSNSGATMILAWAAVDGVWAHWGPLAQWLMWVSLASVAAITAGLILLGPLARERRSLSDLQVDLRN